MKKKTLSMNLCKAVIVTRKDGSEVECHAARELQKYIKQISGVELPLLHQPDKKKTNIYIGSVAPSQGLDLSEEALGFDGYIVKTSGNDLILTGAKLYSCLYAVYHLLERYLGCGFFEDGDQVPTQKTLVIPKINDRWRPFFELRWVLCGCNAGYSTNFWNFNDWKRYFDWAMKRRMNTLRVYLHLAGPAHGLALKSLGVDVELTAWERMQLALQKRWTKYARSLGLKLILPGEMETSSGGNWSKFVEKYKEQIQYIKSDWFGHERYIVPPTDPMFHRLNEAMVRTCIEQFGTDHLYNISMASEENVEMPLEDIPEWGAHQIHEVIKTLKSVDPKGRVLLDLWCMVSSEDGGKRGAYAKGAMLALQREEDLIGMEIDTENPPHPHYFELYASPQGYYYGKPWTAGVVHGGGGCRNLFGDIPRLIKFFQTLAQDPKACNLIGIGRMSEDINHNPLFWACFTEIAFNPLQVQLDDFLTRYALMRYGSNGAGMRPALELLAKSVYSSDNTSLLNRPFYRVLEGRGTWTPLEEQTKRMIGYSPDLAEALKIMLAQRELLGKSPLYQRDLVDIGLQYLGGCGTDYWKRVKTAFESRDLEYFEHWAEWVEQMMEWQIHLASAWADYRMSTHIAKAKRFQKYHTEDCGRGIRILYTMLFYELPMLDYAGRDWAELLKYVYKPQIDLRLHHMWNELSGKEFKDTASLLSETHGSAMLMDYRSSSAFKGDIEIYKKFVDEGYPARGIACPKVPIPDLITEILKRFPPDRNRKIVLCNVEPAQCQMTPGIPMEFKCGLFNPTASAKKTTITMVMPKGFEAVYDPKVVVGAGQSKTVPINVDANPFDVSPGDYLLVFKLAGVPFPRIVTVRQAWRVTSGNELQVSSRTGRTYGGKSLTLSWKTKAGRPGAETFDSLEIPPGVFRRKVDIPADVVPFSGEIRHGNTLLDACWLGKADGVELWDSLPKQPFCSTMLSSNKTKQTDWPDLYGEGSGLLLERVYPDPAVTYHGTHSSRALVFIHHNPRTFFLDIFLRDFDYDQPYSDTGPLYQGTAVELGLAAGPEKADFICSMALTSKGPQVCVYPQDNSTALYVDLQARFKAFLLPEQKMITYHYALDWDRAAIKPLHQVRLGLVIRAKGGEMIELFSGIQNKGNLKDAGSFGVVTLT